MMRSNGKQSMHVWGVRKKRMWRQTCAAMALLLFCLMFSGESVKASSFGGDYRYWSQGGSDYSGMRQVGCLITAQAKMLYEANVNRDASFNPDAWYNCLLANGWIASSNDLNMRDHNAPVYYANSRGKNLEYLGYWNADDAQLWFNINAGYYTIVNVGGTNTGGTHFVLVDNALSKQTGRLYCYDSFSDRGTVSQQLLTRYSIHRGGHVYRGNNTAASSNLISLWGIEEGKEVSGVTKLWAKRGDSDPNHYAIWYMDDVAITGHTSSDSNGFFSVNIDTTKYSNGTHQLSIYYVNTAAGHWDVRHINISNAVHTHSYSGSVTKQPTCTQAGVKTFTCSCGSSYTEAVNAKGHSYGQTVVAPTLTDRGYTLHTCSVCGNSYADNYVDFPTQNADGWYYCDSLPASVSSGDYVVQYKNYYEKTQAASPGAGWTNAGTIKNEWQNSGNTYTSESDLQTSDARVLVRSVFYHFCGPNAGNEGNYEQSGNFVHYDEIASTSVTSRYLGTDNGHPYYYIDWIDGGGRVWCKSGVSCDGAYGTHGNRCCAWYKLNTYQDKVRVVQYKFTKTSDWTDTRDSSAVSVRIRFRALEPTEPDIEEPEITEPDTEKSEITEPDKEETETTEPRTTEPEMEKPEPTEPDKKEPETTEPDTEKPEPTESAIDEPEVTELDKEEPGTTEPGTEKSDTGVTEAGTTEPGTIEPDTEASDVNKPNHSQENSSKWNTGSSSAGKVQIPLVSKVYSLKAKAGKKKLKLSWNKVYGAAGYEIEIDTMKYFFGPKTITVSGAKDAYTKSGLKAKKKYYVRIRAYKTYRDARGYTQKVYGSWSKVSKKTK